MRKNMSYKRGQHKNRYMNAKDGYKASKHTRRKEKNWERDGLIWRTVAP